MGETRPLPKAGAPPGVDSGPDDGASARGMAAYRGGRPELLHVRSALHPSLSLHPSSLDLPPLEWVHSIPPLSISILSSGWTPSLSYQVFLSSSPSPHQVVFSPSTSPDSAHYRGGIQREEGCRARRRGEREGDGCLPRGAAGALAHQVFFSPSTCPDSAP